MMVAKDRSSSSRSKKKRAPETELEDLLRRSTDIPPLFFVGHNHAGAFRISVTSQGDGTFDLRELAALNWLCCDILKNGYRGHFNTIDALLRMKRWGKIAETYSKAGGPFEDLLEAVAELPALSREALYDPDPANLQHEMLTMFEADIGRE